MYKLIFGTYSWAAMAGMSYTITWVFGLAACTGLYCIHIIFGYDKDYFDARRI